MLTSQDAREDVDRRIAKGFSRWTGEPLVVLPYSRDLDAATRLRGLMEIPGRRSGSLRPITLDGHAAFIYVCYGEQQQPFAQGVGPTPALAICDAFLLCCPPEP